MEGHYDIWQKNAMRASADRAEAAGARPISSWSKKEILKVLERRYDRLTASIAEEFPQWFLVDHLLRLYSVERTGAYSRPTQYYKIDDDAAEVLVADPWSVRERFEEEKQLRKMMKRLQSASPKEWPRRYALYRKYRHLDIPDDTFGDMGISLGELARLCEQQAKASDS